MHPIGPPRIGGAGVAITHKEPGTIQALLERLNTFQFCFRKEEPKFTPSIEHSDMASSTKPLISVAVRARDLRHQ